MARETVLTRQVKEVLSWMIAAHLLRTIDVPLWLSETHPGGGQYDCLTLITEGGEQVVLLNRRGDSALVRGEVVTDIWRLASESPGAGPRGAADVLAEMSELPRGPAVELGGCANAAVLIANWLNLNRSQGRDVHAVPVFASSPDAGDHVRTDLLDGFAGIDDWLDVNPPMPGLPASAWIWALQRGEKVAALVNTRTGRALRVRGVNHRWPSTYLDANGVPSCPVAFEVTAIEGGGRELSRTCELVHFASRYARHLGQQYPGGEVSMRPLFTVPPAFVWEMPDGEG